MSTAIHDRAALRRRNALFALFLLPGLGLASWVTRTPDVRDLLGASTAEMGLVLFGLSVGSMVGILSSGALVSRFGTRPIVVLGMSGLVVALPVIGVGGALGMPVLVAVGLACFGFGMGGGEIAMNVEGAEVERLLGRPVLPALHGCFSLGTVIGALIGMAFTALAFPVEWHLGGMAVIALVVLLVAIRSVPAGFGKGAPRTRGERRDPATRVVLWRDKRLLAIGGIVLAMAFAEGAANDWLPLLMVDGHGFDPALGSAVFAIFAAAMTVGRFTGGFFIARFGRAAVMRVSALFGAAGIALVVFVDNPVIAAAAVLLWGLGASLGFPVAISAAGDSGPAAQSAQRVAQAAIVGYLAFLVGPPLLGLLGEELGLRLAMIVVLVLVAGAVLLAPAVREQRGAAAEEPAVRAH
jgi:MFS family permease